MRWSLCAAVAGALSFVCVASCTKKETIPPPNEPVAASLFDADYSFQCSQQDVGCAGILPVRGEKGTEVGVLWGGEEAFAQRIATLREAQRSIRIQALIFRGDESGLFIASLLKQKKKQGLDVRVIVDAASNLDVPTQWMYFDLKQHGIEVEGYEALYLEWLTAEKILEPWRANKRFHDKMWVVDAEDPAKGVAIVGGLNIANEYFRVDSVPINRWHDQDVVVRGPMVKDVADTFDRNYDFFKGIKGRMPTILNPDNSWKLTRATLNKVSKIDVPTWTNPTLQKAVAEAARRELRVGYHRVTARFLQSRPRLGETFIQQVYMKFIEQAERMIILSNAYFIPSREMIDALKAAARRGVRVVILTNSPETNDIAPLALVSRYIYKDLMEVNESAAEGTLEIREWIGPEIGEGTLHAKYAVFDEDLTIVGSYNLDPRSERLNSETALAIRDNRIAGALRLHFFDEMVKKSRAVTWQEVQAFKRPESLADKFDLLLALPMKDWL